MKEYPFYRLKEAQNRELVYGIIGQFWKAVVRRADPQPGRVR